MTAWLDFAIILLAILLGIGVGLLFCRLRKLRPPPPSPTALTIFQFEGGHLMAITGVTPGGTNVFGELPLPPGSAFPTGTTFAWTVDDTADISLAPSTDGTLTTTCIAKPAQNSFNLTCTSSFVPPGAAAPLSKTVLVPILAPPVPTAMDIEQIS